MKETCGNCKSSKPLDKAIVKKSVELRVRIAKARELIKSERKEKIAAIKESAEYLDLLKVKGLISVTEKVTDPEEGSVYIVCPNAEHLKDEKAEGGVVHKYYFKCPHFEA